MDKYISYAESGVSIEANDRMVERIYSSLAGTFGPRVIEARNGFAGMFRLDYDERLFKKNYRSPVLVACTDGVGSKVQLAARTRKFDTVGIDLVAMSANDMLVVGAEPLFFLDYLAVHQLEPALVGDLVQGIARGCKMAECALIGGETAEMPDTYDSGDFDMAGFAVGVVEKDKIIDPQRVCPGDIVLGLASSGLHSNGYTLARTICFKRCQFQLSDTPDELKGTTVQDALLEPTRIYVGSIIRLLSRYKVKRVVHAMAHITGGGLVGNLPRVLPENCNAIIDISGWPIPSVFTFLQARGPVESEEMYRVFNMGIGFVLIVAPDFANSMTAQLSRLGERVYRIGTITRGNGRVVLK